MGILKLSRQLTIKVAEYIFICLRPEVWWFLVNLEKEGLSCKSSESSAPAHQSSWKFQIFGFVQLAISYSYMIWLIEIKSWLRKILV